MSGAIEERLAQVLGRTNIAAHARYIIPALLLTMAASAPLLIYKRRSTTAGSSQHAGDENLFPDTDPESTDPPLLQKHSEIKSYQTSHFTYPGVRVFYRRHPKADQLPSTPAPIPLLVFVHGLGGSAAQFTSLLTSLIHVSSCLAIDLPGCGLSEYAPKDWDAYKTEALVELLDTIIHDYRDKTTDQDVVLIGHSMGTALAARLASKTVLNPASISRHVVGLVAICPPSEPPPVKQAGLARKFLSIPTPILDLYRAWDKRGGLESASVSRFIGADASKEAKKLQYRFNCQSRTPVWRRMAYGFLPTYHDGDTHGGFAGREVWKGLKIPVYLVAGRDDHITKPSDAERIHEWLSEDVDSTASPRDGPIIVDSAAPLEVPIKRPDTRGKSRIEDLTDEDFQRARHRVSLDDLQEDPSTPREGSTEIPTSPLRPRRSVELIILPSPATHALLYAPSTARMLAGLVSDFLSTSISGRLSLGWQLQYLSKEGKWDVKNLAKWKNVEPVSDPIAGIFRAMKTLREVDEIHSPKSFVENWGHSIRDIIDISHDTPVYDPAGLEAGGIRYHKFPSVSKIPPTPEEVEAFIALVDKVRAEQREKLQGDMKAAVAVHCHYGFNRTGFFIVCYLIERVGFSVQAAIDEFARARPKGIRHQHFLDQLFVRYSSLDMKRKQEQ
ncbi:hypothetical protein MCOR21_005196 [Pyricularia oryzae]|uniref:Tyrosine specific protein phosphatases domain-containing protein n=1 Tax=Pyricularia grisea TaxID=148305 RepID=A0ABQ8N6W3_PYRGI|nr:hypothetical protein MCOR19_009803 [Pyricularia oryzae]KAI6292289.1 hypothetical protein MCOR33_009977 [Pyricularia grisea]KAI6354800.1 hypothetical protein MCOR32_010455 [Pyricularia oryzae]KAI6429052.1 hypothetical protein MCOR21_005196 [Pyricularia oryzae]KAI6430026.1 hypothetical protein MCOR22_010186 [Pyricularia oryzae]